MEIRALVRQEETVRWSALAVTIISIAALGFRLAGIKVAYDSADPGSTLAMTVATAAIVLVGVSSLLILLHHMLVAWKNNRSPEVWEKCLSLIFLVVVPYGLITYYWLVYRRMDRNGQLRLF